MKVLIISCLLFALFGLAFSEADEPLSREKRQEKRIFGHGFNRPSYNRPSYNRPSYNRPSYNTPSYNRPSYNRPNYNRPNYNNPSFPTSNYGNNNPGLSINFPLGNPGGHVQNNLQPHNPAVLGAIAALFGQAAQGNNNYYGPPTQSPFIGFQAVGPNNRPAFTYADQNTQIHVRKGPKKN